MKKTWHELVGQSLVATLYEIQKSLTEKRYQDTIEGVNVLLNNELNKEKQELSSMLEKLMRTIIKGMLKPQLRNGDWLISIDVLRDEILFKILEIPGLNNTYLKEIWADELKMAQDLAAVETECKLEDVPTLTWEDVFTKTYSFLHDD